jgi:hypothetical protein
LHSLVSWRPQPDAPDLKPPPSDLIFSCLFPLLDASTILSDASACFRLTTFVKHLQHVVLQPQHVVSELNTWSLLPQHWAFSLMNDNLYHQSADGIYWRRVVRQDEQEEVLRECHSGVAGGHYVGEVTARKVWQSRLWWPKVLRDAHLFTKECDVCQRTGQPQESARMLHQPVFR